ncbi:MULTISPECIES: tripartite tricarboxylate transporter substrate binding protein [Cupriavidus]|jgi:tripartite-type tricarboxylate transporter receptor subunit TctC|uniref:Extra-cytoplasmic solute receptor protein n=2 Tax=Cupriavidus metallidurans TaxID=119219 RepID=Q1LGQ5_CUPMC|nr:MULTISPECIES: tripartite tricarboxylate transporter substrate binding protein [Cupriavidus]ABF10671.1 extra-cytoplasmic solute receptor protein [Cupriavidus metallidurans CH34]KWR80910.1 MFS transporter [Cupriavidus sp. SHE]QBP14015.1 tripartite tricarboxylate transporter substrate binding protein [Cupriavidus metallidurans]QGS31861.1 tripartite tricarboxylate transporter substrate binding protein [Cupriavidus metallidurans]QWC91794.1 tripartite tricarboxylate transporter substrate binding 
MQSPRSFAMRRRLLAAGLLGAVAHPLSALAADTWPSKPVRMIVPFPPGGPVDTTARIFGQKLGEMWKVPVVIDNRPGAGGVIGATVAAKEPADGYSLFVGAIHHSVNPSLMGKLPYDIEKDFAPVSFATMYPIFVVVHPSVPANNIKEFIAYAKKSDKPLAFGSSGNGGGTHLAGELFNMEAGTKLQHIPYKGSAPAMSDLLGGQVQVMFSDAPTALPHIKTGRIKVLGVASRQRSAILPDVPTVAESGLPGYEAYSWSALFAPAHTPQPILNKLNADFNVAMNDPAVRQRMVQAGADADPGTQEQMRQRLHSEIEKWKKVIQTAGITAG